MGDPKRIRKKYETPRHPWIGSRIKEEKQLMKEFGLSNKKEIWKMGTYLKRFKDRAKALIAQEGAQADKEREQLISRMTRLGLIKHGASFDDILGLSIRDLLGRRLQTLMVKKNLARTPRQARQMIVHRHVVVGNTVVTSPGYLVTVEEEAGIGFTTRSPFISEQHPERFSEEELLKKRAKEAKTKKEAKGEDDVLAFDEKDIAEAEVLTGEKKAEDLEPESPPVPEETDAQQAAAAPDATPKEASEQATETTTETATETAAAPSTAEGTDDANAASDKKAAAENADGTTQDTAKATDAADTAESTQPEGKQ